MAWGLLFIAGLFEIGWAIGLKYTEGFSLTEREFRLIKEEIEPGARTFLIKQGHVSVVAKLDLQGFEFELDVISGRKRNVQLMQRLMAEHGEDPRAWLPRFREARAAERAAAARPSHPSAPTQERTHVAA